MVGSINTIGNVNATANYSGCGKVQALKNPVFKSEEKSDVLEIKNKVNAPEISKTRLMFSRLTDEQIAAVNASGKLPDNAKFIPNGFGGYTICNNFFGLRAGTQKLPVGFEVKKNAFGFTCVLPIGTKGIMIKE